MKIGPLALFAKTNSPRSFNIAAWHSPHSLTWSWIFAVQFSGEWRFNEYATRKGLRFAFSPYCTNGGPQWVLVLPFVAFHWHRQKEMWFRDMFRRARDREEALERANSKLRSELTMARALALVEPEGEA